MFPEFKPIDYVMIGIFNYVFHFGIMAWLYGVWTGAIVLIVGWHLWRRYEQWRLYN